MVLDPNGRAQFYDLLRRRGEPIFYAFDCLMHKGRDLRELPLFRRKAILERIVPGHPRVLLARHIDRDGCALFRVVCEQDLEGVVAKRRDGAHGVDWFKIRNRRYSQYEGRHELFERASWAFAPALLLPPVEVFAALIAASLLQPSPSAPLR